MIKMLMKVNEYLMTSWISLKTEDLGFTHHDRFEVHEILMGISVISNPIGIAKVT